MHSVFYNTLVIYFETSWPNFNNSDTRRELFFEELIGNGAEKSIVQNSRTVLILKFQNYLVIKERDNIHMSS